MKPILLTLLILAFAFTALTQSLEPKFIGHEYADMLAINFQRYDSAINLPNVPIPASYHVVYRSVETGLQNRFNTWYRADNKVAVISFRGSVAGMASWLANYYAAMVPAIGSLQINDSTRLDYQLAADSAAHVHIGWLVALAHLAPALTEQIHAAYAAGIREIIITGHSQGGALATLARSYLFYLTQKGALPSDIVYKTYASASPKVGNMVYAYDYDFINRGGWAYTVVNAADWVPETQFSIQTLTDFSPLNPFVNVEPLLGKQPVLVRWVIKRKYRKMRNALRTAQGRFEKNLGSMMYGFVHKILPQFKEPVYVHDNNYQRAGIPVILQPDAEYYQRFPNNSSNIFQHHMYAPYYILTKKYYAD